MTGRFSKAELLESSAKRFPWSREDAERIVNACNDAGSALSSVEIAIRPLLDEIESDEDNHCKRQKRRMLRSLAESMSELSDITEAIYAKFPDLAPEDLRKYYTA